MIWKKRDLSPPTFAMLKNVYKKKNVKQMHAVNTTLRISLMKLWRLAKRKNPKHSSIPYAQNATNVATRLSINTRNQSRVGD